MKNELRRTLEPMAASYDVAFTMYGVDDDFTVELGERAVSINRWQTKGAWQTKVGWYSSDSSSKGLEPMRKLRKILELADLMTMVIEAATK